VGEGGNGARDNFQGEGEKADAGLGINLWSQLHGGVEQTIPKTQEPKEGLTSWPFGLYHLEEERVAGWETYHGGRVGRGEKKTSRRKLIQGGNPGGEGSCGSKKGPSKGGQKRNQDHIENTSSIQEAQRTDAYEGETTFP